MIKRKDKNDNMPVGELKKVKDFLPSPEDLVVPQRTVKVTLTLTQDSLDFFKRQAKKNRTKYQKMIREVVDQYARHFD